MIKLLCGNLRKLEVVQIIAQIPFPKFSPTFNILGHSCEGRILENKIEETQMKEQVTSYPNNIMPEILLEEKVNGYEAYKIEMTIAKGRDEEDKEGDKVSPQLKPKLGY